MWSMFGYDKTIIIELVAMEINSSLKWDSQLRIESIEWKYIRNDMLALRDGNHNNNVHNGRSIYLST